MASVRPDLERIWAITRQLEAMYREWNALEDREWRRAIVPTQAFPGMFQRHVDMAGGFDDDERPRSARRHRRHDGGVRGARVLSRSQNLGDARRVRTRRSTPTQCRWRPSRWEADGLFDGSGLSLAEARETDAAGLQNLFIEAVAQPVSRRRFRRFRDGSAPSRTPRVVGAPAFERGAVLLVGGDHAVTVVPVQPRLGVQPERAPGLGGVIAAKMSSRGGRPLVRASPSTITVARGWELVLDQCQELEPTLVRSRCSRTYVGDAGVCGRSPRDLRGSRARRSNTSVTSEMRSMNRSRGVCPERVVEGRGERRGRGARARDAGARRRRGRRSRVSWVVGAGTSDRSGRHRTEARRASSCGSRRAHGACGP